MAVVSSHEPYPAELNELPECRYVSGTAGGATRFTCCCIRFGRRDIPSVFTARVQRFSKIKLRIWCNPMRYQMPVMPNYKIAFLLYKIFLLYFRIQSLFAESISEVVWFELLARQILIRTQREIFLFFLHFFALNHKGSLKWNRSKRHRKSINQKSKANNNCIEIINIWVILTSQPPHYKCSFALFVFNACVCVVVVAECEWLYTRC